MPYRPPSRCLKCRRLTVGPCLRCRPPGWSSGPSANWKRGNDRRWAKVRADYLAEHPLCEWCADTATEVDHRDGTDYDTERYNPECLRSLCTPCHRRRTAMQGVEARARKRAEREEQA